MKENFNRELSITSQLNAMIQRYQQTTLISSALRFGVWAGLTIVIFCVLDFFLPLPIEGRWGLSGLMYACFATLISWVLIKPFIKKMNQERMAWMLEEKCQSFDESLVSALSFEEQSKQDVSKEMKEKVVDDAEASLHQYHPLVLFRIDKKWLGIAMMAGLVYLGLFVAFNPHSTLLLKRVFLPSDMDARPGSFVLEEIFPDQAFYVEGDRVEFRVRASGRQPEAIKLKIRQNSDRLVDLVWNEETKVFETEINGLVGDLYYRFQSEDVITGERFLKYIPRPKIESFEITYNYPDYTGLPVKKIDSRSGDLLAVVGSKVDVKVLTSKRISSHSLNWLEQNEEHHHNSPGVLEFNFNKTIEVGGEYKIDLVDQEKVKSQLTPTFKVEAIPDKAPEVSWLGMELEIYLTPKSKLLTQWIAEDDFGIVHQKLSLLDKEKELASLVIDPEDRDVELELSNYNLTDGSSLDLVLHVSDALQTRRSEVIKLYIVDDEKVQFALPFVQRSQEAIDKLDELHLELNKVQNTIELIPEIVETSSEFDKGEREHQLGVQQIRLQRLADKMNDLQNDVEDLQTMAFFNKSQAALSLESRYFEHLQINEFTPLLDQPDSEEPLEKLILSTELNKNLLGALRNRAQNHHDKFEMVRHLKLKQKVSDNIIRGLEEKYLSSINYLKDLKAEKPQQGLNAIYIKDRKWYPDQIKNGYPSNIDRNFVSPKVDYPNIASMGWSHHQIFSAIWYGYLKVNKKGIHKFFTNSDDGSRCYINGKLVVRNDGDHAMQEKSGVIYLEPGYHFVELYYYNSASEAGMQWRWQPPNEGKYTVPSHVLRTQLNSREMEQYWDESLTYSIDKELRNDHPIDQAMKAIESQLPKNSLDLNTALAQLDEDEDASWKKAEQVQSMLETLSEETDNEELADTQSDAAELLAEIIDDKSRERLEEFNDLLNDAKREEEDGRQFLSPEVKPALEAMKKDEITHLEQALAELLNQMDSKEPTEEQSSQALSEAMAHAQKAEEELLESLIESLQDPNQKDEIKGDMALLKSLEKATAEQENSLASDQKKAENLQKALEEAKELAEANEAFEKNQMSQQEEKDHLEKVDALLAELANEKEQQNLNLRDQLQSLQKDSESMQKQSEQLKKQQNHQSAKALADKAEKTKQELQALQEEDSQQQPINPLVSQDNPKVNLDQLSHQIHNLKEKLNKANEQQNNRKGAQQMAGIQRAKAQEMLSEMDREQLDHQQDQAYEKVQNSLNNDLKETRDALNRLADRMHEDKTTSREIRDLAKEMNPIVDRENQIDNYRRGEQDRLKEMKQVGQQVKRELDKSALPEVQSMQKALESSLAAADEGRYDDARKSIEALEKDALALADVQENNLIDESLAASQALAHLNKAEPKVQQQNKGAIQEAKELTQKRNYEEASKKLEPLLSENKKALDRLEKVRDIADMQNDSKHALDAAEREAKQGRLQHASMKLAASEEHRELAQELLELEQDKQELLSQLEERKTKENDQDTRKDLQDAINDGHRGKLDQMHRELDRSKGDLDELATKAEELLKREERLEKALDQAQKSQKDKIAQAQSELKKEISQEQSEIRSQMNKTKDQKQRQQLQQKLNAANQDYRMAQSHDLNGYQHKLENDLKGLADAQKAQEALAVAQELSNGNSSSPELSKQSQEQLAAAEQSLGKAQEPLEQGKATQESTQNFQAASDTLASMVANMDAQLLAELQQQKDAMGQASAAGSLAQSNSASEESSESGGQFQFDPEEGNVEFGPGDWNDLQGALKEQGGQAAENVYDDYFNQANNRYLQKILKESRKWK